MVTTRVLSSNKLGDWLEPYPSHHPGRILSSNSQHLSNFNACKIQTPNRSKSFDHSILPKAFALESPKSEGVAPPKLSDLLGAACMRKKSLQWAYPAWWPGTTVSSMAWLELGVGLGLLAEVAVESSSRRRRGRWPQRPDRRILSGSESGSGRAVCPVGPDPLGPSPAPSPAPAGGRLIFSTVQAWGRETSRQSDPCAASALRETNGFATGEGLGGQVPGGVAQAGSSGGGRISRNQVLTATISSRAKGHKWSPSRWMRRAVQVL